MFQDTDSKLAAVQAELAQTASFKERAAGAIRRTFDMLLDGVNTGRYRWEQLYKTEKTHFGTLVEINLQREFDFPGGEKLDYSIAGVEVDCKYSYSESWMIPPEAHGELCMVVAASDQESTWSLGLVRARAEYLNFGRNRDGKATLSAEGRANIHWLYRDSKLPENILLHLPQTDVDAIFAPKTGQQKVNELFRRAQGRIVRRAVIATVAKQLDPMRRVRRGGGSRRDLQKEGIVILGHYAGHQRVVAALDLPQPRNGEVVGTRIVQKKSHHSGRSTFTAADGKQYVVALQDDPVEPAPDIDHITNEAKASQA
ncbi:hypothetical protein GCM10009854_12940 [Saccharopolyspora halophila]|uniref:Type II restriction enzyme NaeI domain-containing protein n=2 Tax=Saccharopolyspora halophila TaxID=405551 RepID=A0ABP5SWU8_9PSEU